MKKFIITLFLLLSTSLLFAFSYSPDATISIGPNFTRYGERIDSYDKARPTFSLSSSISLISFTTDENVRLSFPFEFGYMGESSVENMTNLLARMRFSCGIKTDLILNVFFSIFINPAIGYTFFPDLDSGALCLMMTTGMSFRMGNYVSISIPIKVVAAKEEAEAEVGVALSIYPFGYKEAK